MRNKVKPLLPIAVAFIVMAWSCNPKKEDKQNKMRKFGLEYTDAWNSQKPEQVASFFEKDGRLIVNKGEPITDRTGIIEFAKGFMTAFPDMELTMDSLVKKGESYNYHWTFKGTNTGPNGTGNKVMFSGFEQWTLSANGLVKKSIGTFDEEEYNLQVQGTSQ